MVNCLKNYMKKGIILSLILTFAFPVSSYAEVNNEEAGGFNVEKIDEDKLKFNKEDADILDNGVTGERMAVSEVHDSVEGYLAAAVQQAMFTI